MFGYSYRWMRPDLADVRDRFLPDRLLQSPVVEKGDVLRPRYADHHPQSTARRLVQQVDSRRRIRAYRIDAEVRHLAEVLGNLRGCRKLIALGVGSEGAVGDALHQETIGAGEQKFPVRGDTDA